jgi:hypothetical protein
LTPLDWLFQHWSPRNVTSRHNDCLTKRAVGERAVGKQARKYSLLIRPRPNSPRLEAAVEAEVDAAAEVALLGKTVAMVVIEPTPAESGRAMMLKCLQRLPIMVA